MLISKINTYCINSKNCTYNKNNQNFKGLPSPQKSFNMSNNEFFYKYGGYKGIVTYDQILSLKNVAEQSQKNKNIPNLAIAFFADPVADILVAASQDDLLKGKAKWTQIDDIESV